MEKNQLGRKIPIKGPVVSTNWDVTLYLLISNPYSEDEDFRKWQLVICFTCGHCPDKHVKVDGDLQEGCLNLTGGSFSNQLNRLLYQVGGGVVVVDERKHLLLQHQRILSTGLDFTMVTIVYGQVWSLTQFI